MLQLILFACLNLFHPFYVSVTEIVQNEHTKTLQISVKIFFDDFETALDKKYKTNIDIIKPKDRKQVDGLITEYINEHLKIKANNKMLSLKYVGYEIQEEAAWCYFETERTDRVQQLSIQNDILFEQHATQINMIHAIVGGQRKSTKLDNPASKVLFTY